MINKQSGQGVVESLLSIPVLLLALGIISKLIYLGALSFITDYHLHEALLCVQHNPLRKCKLILENKINAITLFNEKIILRIREDRIFIYGSVEIESKPTLSFNKAYNKWIF